MSVLPPDFPRMIAREALAELPIQRYEGEVCLVSTPRDLERAREAFHDEAVVGFDTETRPAFRKGEHYPPCLAQVATANTVFLFQLGRIDCAEVLAGMLGADHLTKAGVGVARDLKELMAVFPFEPRSVFDPGHAARRHDIEQTGVRNLAALFLGVRIPKGARTSNWAAPRLTPAQIGYAATDAWVSRELYLAFRRMGLVEARH